jgi:hypothetical protein
MNEQAQITEVVQTAQIAGIVKAVVSEIVPALRESIPADMKLWDAQTCAEYFGVSCDYFYKHISASTTFPAPAVDLNKGGKKRKQRWRPREVMRWRG